MLECPGRETVAANLPMEAGTVSETPRHSVSVTAVVVRDDGRVLLTRRADARRWRPETLPGLRGRDREIYRARPVAGMTYLRKPVPRRPLSRMFAMFLPPANDCKQPIWSCVATGAHCARPGACVNQRVPGLGHMSQSLGQ